MSASHDAPVISKEPWQGGRTAMMVGGVLGVAGIGLWVAMAVGSTERAMYSWLFAFMAFFMPTMVAIGWLCAFHAAKARWITVPRRTLEIMANVAPLFIVLLIPMIATMKTVYPWMHPEDQPEELRRMIEHREVWLNHTFVLVRAVFYFFTFTIIPHLLLKWSTEQDAGNKPINTARFWRLGPGALPFLGLSITFFAFDWVMSTSTSFFSSMFGLYLIGGGAMASMALWILTTFAVRTPVSGHHMHSMGKFMFAFTCFWAYTGFAQFMLIWIADIPDETPYFHQRIWTSWYYVSWFLVIFHFVLPFIILLSKRLKFSKVGLGFMAVWMLIAHVVDIYWLIIPQAPGQADGPAPALSDLGAFLGIGGLWLAFFVFRMRGRVLVPVGDPFLQTSVEYHP